MSVTAAERWVQTRSFHHSLYTAERIAAERRHSVTVCLPARECAGTVGAVVGELLALRDRGVLDEIVVVDAASGDGTAAIAARAGATVWQERELMDSHGPVLGKGDAMWRALSGIESDLVCFLDADTEAFSAHFATGLLGPLVCEPGVSFVKGFYRRPLGDGRIEGAGGVDAGEGQGGVGQSGEDQGGVGQSGEHQGGVGEGGGRVNHLMARPALALFFPELAGMRQPLAGEVAARRELLMALPFATGYGVEVAMLIDVWRKVGLKGMAQVDLEEHRNPHQPLSALAPMAATVLAMIARRVRQEGRLSGVPDEGPVERPALAETMVV